MGEIEAGDTGSGENGGMELDAVMRQPGSAAGRVPDRPGCSQAVMSDDLRFVLGFEGHSNSLSRRTKYEEVVEIINSLGHDGKKYRREAVRGLRAIVSEVYSAPRVTDTARRHPRLGILPGTAFDLTVNDENGQPWNFSIPAQRRRAEEKIDREQPILLIGSPSCTPFSNIQNLNKDKRDPKEIEKELIEGRLHLAWCCHLYKKQAARGADFLHEHPNSATSWKEACIQAVLGMEGVQRIVADRCQLGQEDDDGNPIKKPTGFMSNSPTMLARLHRRCFGRDGLCSRQKGGKHVQRLGKRAQRAAIFQEEPCLTILRGLRDQLIHDGRMRRNEVGIHTVEDAIERPSDAIKRHVCKFCRGDCRAGCSQRPAEGESRQSSWLLKMSWKGEDSVDDLAGLPLPPDLCSGEEEGTGVFQVEGGVGTAVGQ